MTRVFADTGFWIAVTNPRDNLHEKALEVSTSLRPMRIVTSEMVLTEVLNSFAGKGEGLRRAACALIDRIQSNSGVESFR